MPAFFCTNIKLECFRRSRLFKISALVVLVCFCVTTVLSGPLSEKAWAEPISRPIINEKLAVTAGTNSSFSGIDVNTVVVPQNLGTIKDAWMPSLKSAGRNNSNNDVVIHIQDAHCNYPAQRKIAEIIKYFQEKYGINTVNLEGGEGSYDLSFFTDIKDPIIREKVSDYFAKEGIVNGAEYYAINNPGKVELNGVENTELYIKNLKVYRDFLKHKPKTEKYIKEFETILSKLKKEIYSEELLEFDEKYDQHKENILKFEDYIVYLERTAKKKAVSIESFSNILVLVKAIQVEKNINFEKANREREILIDELRYRLSKNSIKELVEKTIEFKQETILPAEFYNFLIRKARIVNISLNSFPELQKYVQYIELYSSMDKTLLMLEISCLEDKIKKVLCENNKQEKLSRLSKTLVLTKNLFNITLTKEDYKYYKANKKSFDTKNYFSFINTCHPGILRSKISGIHKLNTYRRHLSQFYEYSFKRDQAFLENLIRHSDCDTTPILSLSGLTGQSRNQLRHSLNDRSGSQGNSLLPQGGDGEITPLTPNDQRLTTNNQRLTTILVTGGFHTGNLTELFKKNNISYITVMPNFKNDNGYESPYFNLLSGGRQMETLKALVRENSNLALYSNFCENVVKVYSLDELEAKALWRELVQAVFEEKKDIIIYGRQYSFSCYFEESEAPGHSVEGKARSPRKRGRISHPIKGLTIDGNQVYASPTLKKSTGGNLNHERKITKSFWGKIVKSGKILKAFLPTIMLFSIGYFVYYRIEAVMYGPVYFQFLRPGSFLYYLDRWYLNDFLVGPFIAVAVYFLEGLSADGYKDVDYKTVERDIRIFSVVGTIIYTGIDECIELCFPVFGTADIWDLMSATFVAWTFSRLPWSSWLEKQEHAIFEIKSAIHNFISRIGNIFINTKNKKEKGNDGVHSQTSELERAEKAEEPPISSHTPGNNPVKMLLFAIPFIGSFLANSRVAHATSLQIAVRSTIIPCGWWIAACLLVVGISIIAYRFILVRKKTESKFFEEEDSEEDFLDEQDEDMEISQDFVPAFSLLTWPLVKKLESARKDLTIEIDCSNNKKAKGNAVLPENLKLNTYEKEQISDYLDKLLEGNIQKNTAGIRNLSELELLPKKFTINFSDQAIIQKEQDTITLPRFLFKGSAALKYILVSEFKRGGLGSEESLVFYRSLTWREQEEIIFYITELCEKGTTNRDILDLLIKENQAKYNLDPEFIVNENRKLFLNKVCIDPWTGEERFKTLYKELRGIVDRLLLAEGLNSVLYEFHLLDDLEENAFVFRYSNHIYLNLGYLKMLCKYKSLTKDIAASIFSHEITHIIQGRNEVDAGEVDSRFRRKRLDEYFNVLKEVYAMEYDADYRALKTLDRAGFRVASAYKDMEAVIRMMKDENKNETMFGTQPQLEERIRRIKEEYSKSLYSNYRKKPEKFSNKALGEISARGFHREFELSIFNCKNLNEINKKVDEAKSLRDIELIKRIGLPYILYEETREMAGEVYSRLSKSDKRSFDQLKKYRSNSWINFGHKRKDEYDGISDFGILAQFQSYAIEQNEQDFKIFIEKVLFSYLRSFLREESFPSIKISSLRNYVPSRKEFIQRKEKFSKVLNIISPEIKNVVSKKFDKTKNNLMKTYSNIVSKEKEFSAVEKYIIKICDFSEYLNFAEGEFQEKEFSEEEIRRLVNNKEVMSELFKFPVFFGLKNLDIDVMEFCVLGILREWQGYFDEKHKRTVVDLIAQWLFNNKEKLSLKDIFELRRLTKENGIENIPWANWLINDKMAKLSADDFKKYQDKWLFVLQSEDTMKLNARFIGLMQKDELFCQKVLAVLSKSDNSEFCETVSCSIASVFEQKTDKLKFLGLGNGAGKDLERLTVLFPNFNETIMYHYFLLPLVKCYGLNKEEEMRLLEKGIWLRDLRNKKREERKLFGQDDLSLSLRDLISAVSEEFIDKEIAGCFKDYGVEPQALKRLDFNAKKLLYYLKAGGMLTHETLREKFHELEKDSTNDGLLLFYKCLRILKNDQAKRGVPISFDAKEEADLNKEITRQYSLNNQDTLTSFFRVRTWDEYLLYIGQYLLFKDKGLDVEKLKEFNLFNIEFSGYKAFFGEMPAQIRLSKEKASKAALTTQIMERNTQALLTGLVQGYNRLSRHKIMRNEQFKMFEYVINSEKGFDELLKELITFLPRSSYLNYALYHLFIFKVVSPLTGQKITLKKMYDPVYIKTLIDSSQQKDCIEKYREKIRKYMLEDKRVELLNLYLFRVRMKEISDFYSLLNGGLEDKRYMRIFAKIITRVLEPIDVILRLLILKGLSKIASRDISSKEYKKVYYLIKLGNKMGITVDSSDIMSLLKCLFAKMTGNDSPYYGKGEDVLRERLKLYLQIYCFSGFNQEKFQLKMFLNHFIFQKLRIFPFFEKYFQRNSAKLEDSETGGIDSQLDILLACQSDSVPFILSKAKDLKKNILWFQNDEIQVWQDKYENQIKKYFPRSSNTRDYLIKTLIESHINELSCEELHDLTKEFYQLSLREKYNLKAIEKDRTANPQDFEGFDKEFSKIREVYFPDYSYTRDDLLLQLIEEKVISRRQYEKVSSVLLLNQDNLKKEEIQNHLFWGDKFKWMVKEMSARDKADFLLWVLDARKKPELIFAIETDLNITLDHLKELFASTHKGYYTRIGMSLRKDLLPTLLYGNGGIFTNTKIEQYFLDNLFKGLIPKRTKNKDVYKKVWNAVFNIVDLDMKIDIMVNLSKAFSEIPKDKSGKIEKDSEGLIIKVFLESCGIIGVKLGQILYSMDIDMSSNIRKELGSLTGSASPLAKATTFSVMDSVFGEFQTYYLELLEPLGSASIKMVYKAKQPEDLIEDAMALKIKKPEIEQKINQELTYLSKILEVLRTQRALDVPKNLEEKIIKQIKKELDFYLEWENQKVLNKIALEFSETDIPETPKVARNFISDILKEIDAEFIDRIMAQLQNAHSGQSADLSNSRVFSNSSESGNLKINIEVPVANAVMGKNKGQAMLEPMAKGKPLEKLETNSDKISEEALIQIKRRNAIFLLFQIFGKGVFHGDLHDGNLFVNRDSEEQDIFTSSIIDLGSVGNISLDESMEFLRIYLALNINSFSNGVFSIPVLGNIVAYNKLRPEAQTQIVETVKKYNSKKSPGQINREIKSFLRKDRAQKDKARSLHKLFARLDNKGISIPESFLALSKAMTAANSIFKDSARNDILSPHETLGLIQTFIEYRRQNKVRGSPVCGTNITGNIVSGFTPDEEDALREKIKKNSNKVRAENEDVVKFAKERCAVLLQDKGNIEYLLKNKNIPDYQISKAIYALENPGEAFKWFEAIVEEEEKYLLGHESALAVNIIRFLGEKETEWGINNLIDEYVFHEALENTNLKHSDIINFTNAFFRRTSHEVPYKTKTPLGRALRMFIQESVMPVQGELRLLRNPKIGHSRESGNLQPTQNERVMDSHFHGNDTLGDSREPLVFERKDNIARKTQDENIPAGSSVRVKQAKFKLLFPNIPTAQFDAGIFREEQKKNPLAHAESMPVENAQPISKNGVTDISRIKENVKQNSFLSAIPDPSVILSELEASEGSKIPVTIHIDNDLIGQYKAFGFKNRDAFIKCFGWKILAKTRKLSGGSITSWQVDNTDQCVTEYAACNPSEDFCDSMVAAIANPTALRTMNDKKFEFLKEKYLKQLLDSNRLSSIRCNVSRVAGNAVKLPRRDDLAMFKRLGFKIKFGKDKNMPVDDSNMPKFKEPEFPDLTKTEPVLTIKKDTIQSRQTAIVEALNSLPQNKALDPIALVGLPENIHSQVNLEDLKREIGRGLARAGHGKPRDTHKVDFFFISQDKLKETENSITDILSKYKDEGRQLVLFMPEMTGLEINSDKLYRKKLETEFKDMLAKDMLTIVADAYSDLDFAVKDKFVDIDSRIAIARLIGWYHEAEGNKTDHSRIDAQEEAMRILTELIKQITGEDRTSEKDLNKLLSVLLLKIRPVDYSGDIKRWEEAQKAIATSL
ncbi:MAG: AarF/UbiB family protein [Candidatus Omnitrophota bacterium]